MTLTEKHIVETYSYLLDGLSAIGKLELIESLSRSLRTEKLTKENKFYESFGAFGSKKTTEVIIDEIKLSRKFRSKDLKF